MAFIPVENVVNLTPEFTLNDGVQAVNSMWIKDNQAGVVAPRVAELCALYVTWWTANVRGAVSTQNSLTRVTGRDMTVADGELVEYVTGLPLAGTNASAALPAHTTITVSLRTGLAGRSRRGRLYHIGLTEGQVVGNFITAAVATNLVAYYGALRTALQANDFDWVVVSRFSGGVPRTEGLATTISSIILVDNRVDTQRRRLPGEGT